MKKMANYIENDNMVYVLSLFLILVGNMCFYTSETLIIFVLVCGTGVGLTFWNVVIKTKFKVSIDYCVVWLTLIYFLFTTYGLFFLQKGYYNWDIILIMYAQCVSLYYIFKGILTLEKWLEKVGIACLYAGVFTILYMCIREARIIIENLQGGGSVRIGDSLSGNVNTVGMTLGILSVFVIYNYCIDKNKWFLLGFSMIAISMLLTGSKKTIIILAVDFLIYVYFVARTKGGLLKIALTMLAGVYLVFGVDFFYNMIGYRIVDMFSQLMLGENSPVYSHSTDVRMVMIKEGLNFFVEHPLFGGGWNYFYAMTSTEYDYSHCNYTELLCNFGLFGFCSYYSPYVYNSGLLLKNYILDKRKVVLALVLLVLTLILDWAMVSFSSLCIYYIPVIFSFAVVKSLNE